MIKSYWFRILFCGIAAALIGFLIAEVLPARYEAEIQVLLAPYVQTVGGSQTPVDESVRDILQSTAPRTVSTQVEMLTSPFILQTAADQVAQEFHKSDTDPSDELFPLQLENRIKINAEQNSDLVTLTVSLSNLEMAKALVADIYLAFDNENQEKSADSASRAIDFLQTQQDKIQDQLTSIENEQAKARMALGAPNIEQMVIALISQKKDYETQVEAVRAEQVASQVKAGDLNRRLADIARQMPGGSSVAENPDYQKLMGLRDEAEAERSQVLQRYLEDSPQVKQYDREIDDLNSKISQTQQYSPNIKGSTAPNPVYEQIYQEYVLADADAKSLADRLASAQSALDRLNAQMGRLPDIQKRLDDLDRQKAVLAQIAELYMEKLKTLQVAKVGRTAATQLWTKRPIGSPKPTYPNYQLCVGLGFFLGLAIGFLWSIGTEAKRNPIRSLGQLNRLSLQPCYRVIPELRTPIHSLNRAPAEVFDSLLANFVRSEKKGYRLGVLGVNRNSGASTTAINLAIAAARGGYSVLYVSLDPSAGALAKLSPGDANGPGSNIAIYNAAQEAGEGNGAAGLPNDLESATKGKDLVIFDFSPVKVSGDAFRFANHLDETLLLVRANHTKSVDFLQAQQALIDAGCPMVTVTLSRVQEQSDDISALEQQADIHAITPQA